jgi:mannose-6-phosphate isomerase-like protein (cupin superfamily)
MSDPHARTPGKSKPISREEMLARIARFREAADDLNAFPDLNDAERERSVKYLVSPQQLAGPAPITAPHHFHLAVLTMQPGIKPVTHAHPYNEVFMPLDQPFIFYWGDGESESVRLEPFDVISIPAGVFRTFENVGEGEGHVTAIFDNGGSDPHTGIVVPQDAYEKYYKDSGWKPSVGGSSE